MSFRAPSRDGAFRRSSSMPTALLPYESAPEPPAALPANRCTKRGSRRKAGGDMPLPVALVCCVLAVHLDGRERQIGMSTETPSPAMGPDDVGAVTPII